LTTETVFYYLESAPGDEITLKDAEFLVNLEELESAPRPPTLFLCLTVINILHKYRRQTRQAIISCLDVEILGIISN